MKLNQLTNIPAWEWPDGADDFLLDVLRDAKTSRDDRITAAELAGDYVVVNDDIARTLLSIAVERSTDEELRCIAAISLGPALEDAAMMDPDDSDDSVISESVFEGLKRGLRKIYMDGDASEAVRRSVLEASVRAPEDWHREAVRGAYANGSAAWKLTAVFCMRFIEGFDDEIAESLASDDRQILREAVLAAGNWEITAAWPIVRELMADPNADKSLRIAAIEAAPGVDQLAASELLIELAASADEDIADAASESLAICAGDLLEDEELEEFDGLDDDEDDTDLDDDEEGDRRH